MQRIPSSFNEFTVKQFQDWQKVSKINFEGEFALENRELSLLSVAMNISIEEAESIPGHILKPMLAKLNALTYSKPNEKVKKFIFVNKKAYQAIIKPSELKDLLNTSQYTAFKEYTKKDCIENMHLILPLLYCPCKFLRKKQIAENTQALSREFLSAKIGDVYGAVFFYSIVWEKLNEASLPYLKKAQETLQAHMEEVIKAFEQGSENPMVGTI